MSTPEQSHALAELESIARNWRGHLTLHVNHSAVVPEWTCQLAYIGVARHPDGELRAEPANWYATGPNFTTAIDNMLDQIHAEHATPGDTP
jgi:hypothetical protein